MRSARRERGILMVEFFARGGGVHYSWQLAQALARQAPEREVMLLTGRRPEPGFAAGCQAGTAGPRLLAELWTWTPHASSPWMPRHLRRAWRGLRYVTAWWQVLRVAQREQPAVVLLNDLEHACDAWFVRRLHRLAQHQPRPWILADIWHNVVAFERNRPGALVRDPAWRRQLAREFDTVFVHGQTLARELEQRTGVRARVIAHGNQTWVAEQAGPDPGVEEWDRRLALPPGRPVALLFGSLSAYKGVGVLVEALAAIPPERRPVAWVAGRPMAGVRPQAWRAEAARLGVEAWLRWDERYVPTEEIAWYFRRADIVVLPYRAASQSGVAHLALTFGRPLIVSDAGSLPEVIDGNGLVVPAGDALALAAALQRLSWDKRLRAQMGKRSLELAATRHNWDTVAQTMLAAWAPAAVHTAPAPVGMRA
jgi:glycosyltransferase involved in cell wall biosynthesis